MRGKTKAHAGNCELPLRTAYCPCQLPLPLQMKGNNDHPRAQPVDGIGQLQPLVAVELVAQPLAHLYLGREDEVRIEELKTHPELITIVRRAYLNELVRAFGAGIGGQVIVELATQQAVEPEILDTVALEFELERQVHVYRLYAPVGHTVVGDAILILQPFRGKEQAGHKAEVYETAQAQVTHQPQVETRLPQRLYALESVRAGERRSIIDAVHREIEAESDTEIV